MEDYQFCHQKGRFVTWYLLSSHYFEKIIGKSVIETILSSTSALKMYKWEEENLRGFCPLRHHSSLLPTPFRCVVTLSRLRNSSRVLLGLKRGPSLASSPELFLPHMTPFKTGLEKCEQESLHN